MSFKIFVVVSTLILSGISSPVPANDLLARYDCNGGDNSVYDESCFDQLKVSDWLKTWEKNTPRCGPNDDTSKCCGTPKNPDEWWSTCFLRLHTTKASYNCQNVAASTCGLDSAVISNFDDDSRPKIRYLVWTIYNINKFFNNWWLALQFATSNVGLFIDDIIQLIDPEMKTNMVLTNILTAFTAGLAFLGLPGVVAGGVQTVAKTAINALSVGVQQAPGVAKAIWPAGTANSQPIQISELKKQLSNLNNQIGDRLDAGLFAIMANVENFASFAAGGAFSGQAGISLPKETDGLDSVFRTFLVSTAMSANKWTVYTGPDSLDTNGLPGNQDKYGCKVRGTGVCDFADGDAPQPNNNPAAPAGSGNNRPVQGYAQGKGWAMWTSKTTKHSYSARWLGEPGTADPPTAAKLMNAIVEKGLGTPEALFDGANQCKGGEPGVQPGGDGKLSFGCLSRVKIEQGCKEATGDCGPFFGKTFQDGNTPETAAAGNPGRPPSRGPRN